MKCVGLLSFTLIASLMAGIAVFGQTSGTISPVPAWPADGNIPDYLKHNYVFLGTRIGEIIVSYPASLDDPREMGRKTFSFELHNLVDPTFSIQTVEHPDGTYVYDYVVRNGPSAKQFIRRWSFTSQATDLSAAGPGWSATRIPSVASRQNGQPNASPTGAIVGSQVVFYSGSGNEVQPGASVEGFRVVSRYSPGFTTAFVGSGSSFDIPSELPSVVADQIGALVTSGFDSQVVLILGPKYPPGWSPKAIAADFQVGMTRLVRSGKLSPNSRFVTEALSALGRIVQGGAVTMGDFVKSLPEPSPGLEREIATAMQLNAR